jgi:hypothetical protein
MYDRLYDLVRELDDRFERVRKAVAEADALTVRHELPGGMGSVIAGGDGRLVAVELEPRTMALRHVSGRQLAAELLDTIHAAEAEAAARREQLIADAQRPIY